MKTSDIFLADKTCLFCEKRKCKRAITQSEADPLTPLTSVHGIDKVFRAALSCSSGITQNVRTLGFSWISHLGKGLPENIPKIFESEADPLTPLTSVHGIDKVFRLLYPIARNCSEWAALGFSWISHLGKDENEKKKKKKDSVKVPSQNSPPVPFHAELEVLFLSGLLHQAGMGAQEKFPSRGNGKVSDKE
ncbi:hypothetical protein CDAR_42611 [Caerostris darwini]|uniref:Uncharacterized protein n=1 Tax=Caerostris darwini TaxID=1538125 RepID=A0AAV4RHW3_9ARAC|nr:hypothetical protein CDAR_42611 [Caerostris darwini]